MFNRHLKLGSYKLKVNYELYIFIIIIIINLKFCNQSGRICLLPSWQQ